MRSNFHRQEAVNAAYGRLYDPALEEHLVYRAFDAAGVLLYVGCSVNIERRMREHAKHTSWHRHMVRFTTEGPYNFRSAREVEWTAIQTENPTHSHQSPQHQARRAAFCAAQRRSA